MTTLVQTLHPAAAPSRRWTLARLFGALLAAGRQARERRALLAMDDRTLRDIGLSRVDALCAAREGQWHRTWRS